MNIRLFTLVPAVVSLLAACGNEAPSLTARDADSAVPEVACETHSDPRVVAMRDDGIELTSTLGLAAGRYALPEQAAPSQLVLMFHGHGNDSCSWRNHMRRFARKGAVTVAMDYVRQEPVENYGWMMREAATQSIAAAQYFLSAYPSISEVFVIGISMGANAAGVAIASADAVRPDGVTPLVDYWVNVEGANNLIEEYLVIRALAPLNDAAALAQQEIEEENGGTFEEVPERYVEITNVLRVQDMTTLKGVVLVQGVDDGLVTSDQKSQMAIALQAVGVPAKDMTVLLHGSGEGGSTATAVVLGPVLDAAGQEYPTLTAGHGWEGSDTQIVIQTGFSELEALLDGAGVESGVELVPG